MSTTNLGHEFTSDRYSEPDSGEYQPAGILLPATEVLRAIEDARITTPEQGSMTFEDYLFWVYDVLVEGVGNKHTVADLHGLQKLRSSMDVTLPAYDKVTIILDQAIELLATEKVRHETGTVSELNAFLVVHPRLIVCKDAEKMMPLESIDKYVGLIEREDIFIDDAYLSDMHRQAMADYDQLYNERPAIINGA